MHTFKFAALRRSTPNSPLEKLTCKAENERAARLQFIREYILVFTAVIRDRGAV